MIVKIVCAGVDCFSKLYKKDDEELLIGVDGGVEYLANLGLRVNLAIGDFDSSDLEEVKKHSDSIKIFPKEKDLGDLELTIKEIENLNIDKIIIYNATGGRLDHFYATINVLIKYYDRFNIEIVDDRNVIRIIDKDTVFKKSHYQYLSIYAIEDDTIISLIGFKYNLDNYNLKLHDNLCLSNEIEEQGTIYVNDKKILIFETL